jgi:hypothetical protein
LRLPTGFTFHPRCRFATDECRIITPELALHTGERLVSCLLYEACRTRPMPSSGSAAPVEEQA